MKKLTLAILTATFVVSAHASLSTQCKGDLEDVVAKRQLTVERIQSGDFTSVDSEFLLRGWDDVAEMTALTCAGIKKIELEKSFKARIGLLSQVEAEDMANQINQDAMKYYYKYSR